MKLVLSGGTGYIGSEVLARCLQNPAVTSVLVLTRRDLPDLANNPKAKVIILKDFNSYDQATIDEVRSADAALWCLGTSYGDERIDIEFPLHFINAIKTGPQRSTPLRYVQLSGAFTEPPPKDGEEERSLWFFANGRRVRGLTEARVLETAEEGPQSGLTIYLVKPGAVVPKYGAFFQKYILGDSLSVTLDALGAAMVDLAVHGHEQKVFSSKEIVEYGRTLLQKTT